MKPFKEIELEAKVSCYEKFKKCQTCGWQRLPTGKDCDNSGIACGLEEPACILNDKVSQRFVLLEEFAEENKKEFETYLKDLEAENE